MLPTSEFSVLHLPHLVSTLTGGLHEPTNKLFTIHSLFEAWLHQSIHLLRTEKNRNRTFCPDELGFPSKCTPSFFALSKKYSDILVLSPCWANAIPQNKGNWETSIAAEQRNCPPSQNISSNISQRYKCSPFLYKNESLTNIRIVLISVRPFRALWESSACRSGYFIRAQIAAIFHHLYHSGSLSLLSLPSKVCTGFAFFKWCLICIPCEFMMNFCHCFCHFAII